MCNLIRFSIKNLPVTYKSRRLGTLFKLFSLPLVSRFIKFHLEKQLFENGSKYKFSQGFRCKYGNIEATDVDFNDTFCLDYGLIKIGSGTSFSFQNVILTSTHSESNFDQVIVKPVTIGTNCWITTRVIILPGVCIGDNVTVAAGSVVVNDLPSNCIAAGNPAKVLRFKGEVE